MKQTKFIFAILLLILFVFQIQGQINNEIFLQLKNISVYPDGIAQPGSGVENITDGKRGTDNEIFHSLWTGIPKQYITIEADIDGKGKRLDKVILSPRAYGVNGIIKNAELWVMVKGKYQQVATVEAKLSNSPFQINLNKKILNPEKIKLVITDSYYDE